MTKVLCSVKHCIHNYDGECGLDEIELDYIFANEGAQCTNKEVKRNVTKDAD